MYRIELTRQAEKQLERVIRIDRRLYERFLHAFDEIAGDPELGKPLWYELKGLRSYRLGDYRIVYKINRGHLIVVIIDLGHRKGIYQ